LQQADLRSQRQHRHYPPLLCWHEPPACAPPNCPAGGPPGWVGHDAGRPAGPGLALRWRDYTPRTPHCCYALKAAPVQAPTCELPTLLSTLAPAPPYRTRAPTAPLPHGTQGSGGWVGAGIGGHHRHPSGIPGCYAAWTAAFENCLVWHDASPFNSWRVTPCFRHTCATICAILHLPPTRLHQAFPRAWARGTYLGVTPLAPLHLLPPGSHGTGKHRDMAASHRSFSG